MSTQMDYDTYLLSTDHDCAENECEIRCEGCGTYGCHWGIVMSKYGQSNGWVRIADDQDLFHCEKCKGEE